jgi:hypothetical protein
MVKIFQSKLYKLVYKFSYDNELPFTVPKERLEFGRS